MPPVIAFILCLAAVSWLFWRDIREKPNVTAALWLPFLWIFISGSRFLSQWLGIFGLNLGGISVEEGSPVDATLFFFIIFAGLYVLHRRQVQWSKFMRENPWVAVYLIYCLLEVLWSDYPLVAAKRWTKLFGQPVMVLVLLTEPDPLEALTRLLKRFAYVAVPFSVLFIKYYPQWGRTFDTWSGLPTNTGITTNKNTLGCDCFIFGMFFVWHFLRTRRREKSKERRNELILCGVFFGAILWLLYMAHSATSIGAFALALAMFGFVALNKAEPRRVGPTLFVGLIVLIFAELVFDLHNYVIAILGRDPTFTDRTLIWHILWNWDINPFFGAGFESFWLGKRLDEFASQFHGIAINEAHNGYLETYIQLGGVGVVLTLILIVATYFRTLRTLVTNFDLGWFRLAYLPAFLAYNWTEAGFRTHCLPLFIFLLCAIDYSTRRDLEEEPSTAANLAPISPVVNKPNEV